MRRIIFAALFILTAFPAFSATPPAKSVRKEETMVLGNNRFLIFVGEPNGSGFAYTADLIIIKDGIPHFEPLFTQEYDADTNTISLSEGIAFQAENYNFDKANGTFGYTIHDLERHQRLHYQYIFATDMFTLQEVVMQKDSSCDKPPCGEMFMPKALYKAKK